MVAVRGVLESAIRHLEDFMKTVTISQSQAELFFSYFFLGSLMSLTRSSPEVFKNSLIFIEQGERYPIVHLSMVSKQESIDKILLQLIVVDFNNFEQEAKEFAHAEELLLRQSSASNQVSFECYKFYIHTSTNQMVPKVLMNLEPAISLHANKFRNLLINSSYSLQGKKYNFEMKPTSHLLYDSFPLFKEKYQINQQKIFEEKMTEFSYNLWKMYERVTKTYKFTTRHPIMAMFALFDGILNFHENQNKILFHSFLVDFQDSLIYLHYEDQPFSLLISIVRNQQDSFEDVLRQQGVCGHVFMINIESRNYMISTDWLHLKPVKLTNFLTEDSVSTEYFLESDLFSMVFKRMTNKIDQKLDRYMVACFLLGQILADAFLSPKCNNNMESCLKIPENVNQLFDLASKISCFGIKNTNDEKINTKDQFDIWHAFKRAIFQCQIGNIDPQYLISGFINLQFNLCKSPVFNVICFIDADNETQNFVYIKQGVHSDKLDMKKAGEEFHKIFLNSIVLNLHQSAKYDMKILLYSEDVYFADFQITDTFLNISDTECETPNLSLLENSNFTRTEATNKIKQLVETYLEMNNPTGFLFDNFKFQDFHLIYDDASTISKSLIFSKIRNEEFISQDCLLGLFMKSIPDYTDQGPVVRTF